MRCAARPARWNGALRETAWCRFSPSRRDVPASCPRGSARPRWGGSIATSPSPRRERICCPMRRLSPTRSRGSGSPRPDVRTAPGIRRITVRGTARVTSSPRNCPRGRACARPRPPARRASCPARRRGSRFAFLPGRRVCGCIDTRACRRRQIPQADCPCTFSNHGPRVPAPRIAANPPSPHTIATDGRAWRNDPGGGQEPSCNSAN